MLELDRELFEEFKQVDAICRDMFSCQNGVSKYIDQMDGTPLSMRYVVSSWDYDYRMLKRVRWLRNQIAHEMTATDCTASDAEYLRDFHNRLLIQQDPLGVLGKARREAQRTSYQRPATAKREPLHTSHYASKPSDRGHGVLWGMIAVAALILFIVLYFLAQGWMT